MGIVVKRLTLSENEFDMVSESEGSTRIAIEIDSFHGKTVDEIEFELSQLLTKTKITDVHLIGCEIGIPNQIHEIACEKLSKVFQQLELSKSTLNEKFTQHKDYNWNAILKLVNSVNIESLI